MTKLAPVLLAAVLAAALPATAPAAGKKKTTCTKRAGDTILRDSSLRVLQTVKHAKGDPDASTVTIHFCRPGSTAKSKTLATFHNTLDGALTVRSATRGGATHVALLLDEQTGTADATDLFVYDIGTRRRTFAYGSESSFEFAATAGGGVAILEAGKLTGYDATGEHALAAVASGLASAENTVYWTANAAAASATLTGAASRQLP